MKKAVIDIDGVLNYYPQTQIDYFNWRLGTEYKTLSEIKESLSYKDYKYYKTEYRMSGFKHDAKPSKGAKKLLKYLRNNNYLIYIITARELFKYNQLEKTIAWLNKNNLYYDYIYCTQKKDFTIFEKFGHIDLVIEDNCDNLEKIKKVNGKKCIYINVINNENINNKYRGYRVVELDEKLIGDLSNLDDSNAILLVSDDRAHPYSSIEKIVNGNDKFIHLKETDTLCW